MTDVIKGQTLYPHHMFKRPMEEIVDTMHRHIRVTNLMEGGKFEVSFAYEDRVKARAATAMLVAKIMASHLNSRDGSTLELKEAPTLPQRSVNPYVVKGIVGGLAAGCLLGSVIVGVRRRRHAVA